MQEIVCDMETTEQPTPAYKLQHSYKVACWTKTREIVMSWVAPLWTTGNFRQWRNYWNGQQTCYEWSTI